MPPTTNDRAAPGLGGLSLGGLSLAGLPSLVFPVLIVNRRAGAGHAACRRS